MGGEVTANLWRPTNLLIAGATGTIGRAVVGEALSRGYRVTCLARSHRTISTGSTAFASRRISPVTETRIVDFADPASLLRDGFRQDRFDAVISCMASRTGVPKDAWEVDYEAQLNLLTAAKSANVGRMILLSAICVQRPLLAFQKAKLAFEEKLVGSSIDYSIVRPTAFFKSLSGQVERVKRGKPFLLFGNGELTACKPISDKDLAHYIIDCVEQDGRKNRILPIGGPGEAVTPRQQGEMLFSLLGREPRFRHIPLALIDAIIAGLNLAGKFIPKAAPKAELAKIGRYYATESMLVLDPETGAYGATATPSTGSDTLAEHYANLLGGKTQNERGDHTVF
ncbi:MAG: NAD(P)H-binding protein [Sphingomonadaceae bacterium]|nr:NAD(P)H-binding protein [Sphingomonadaceae bacterium]